MEMWFSQIMNWKGWISPLLHLHQALHTNTSYRRVETPIINQTPTSEQTLRQFRTWLVSKHCTIGNRLMISYNQMVGS
jgi:hypothetical protein